MPNPNLKSMASQTRLDHCCTIIIACLIPRSPHFSLFGLCSHKYMESERAMKNHSSTVYYCKCKPKIVRGRAENELGYIAHHHNRMPHPHATPPHLVEIWYNVLGGSEVRHHKLAHNGCKHLTTTPLNWSGERQGERRTGGREEGGKMRK